jgi:hypothetical protein
MDTDMTLAETAASTESAHTTRPFRHMRAESAVKQITEIIDKYCDAQCQPIEILADSAFSEFAGVLSVKRTFPGRTNFCPLKPVSNGNLDTLNAGRKCGHGWGAWRWSRRDAANFRG